MTGLFAPESKSTEFFAFFAVAGKSSSFIGPATFGLLAAGIAGFFEKRGIDPIQAEQFGTRAGLATIAFFLIIGLGILLSVNEKRARQVAEDYVPDED
jgi:UMF1 family MFS transporter